jgi:hypothetical protein
MYSIGIDIAEGKYDEECLDASGRDWTVFTGIRTDTGEEVFMFRDQCDPDIAAGYAVSLAVMYNNGLIMPERNNHGHQFISRVTKVIGYKNVYKELPSKSEIELARKHGRSVKTLYGFGSTGFKKRTEIIDELRRVIREEEIRIHSEKTLRELLNFVEYPNGKEMASPGSKDDLVISIALAVKGRGKAKTVKLTDEDRVWRQIGGYRVESGKDAYGVPGNRRMSAGRKARTFY